MERTCAHAAPGARLHPTPLGAHFVTPMCATPFQQPPALRRDVSVRYENVTHAQIETHSLPNVKGHAAAWSKGNAGSESLDDSASTNSAYFTNTSTVKTGRGDSKKVD